MFQPLNEWLVSLGLEMLVLLATVQRPNSDVDPKRLARDKETTEYKSTLRKVSKTHKTHKTPTYNPRAYPQVGPKDEIKTTVRHVVGSMYACMHVL